MNFQNVILLCILVVVAFSVLVRGEQYADYS